MKIKQALALFVFLLSIGARAEDVESDLTMDGIYEMTIKIGTQTYLNTLVLTGKTRPITAYSIILTRDEKMKRELFEPHFRHEMVLQAPVIMTFCADFHRMRKWLELSDAPDNFDNFMSFMIGAIDAVLASQNAVLAAEAEGLGVCYMGTTLASCLKIASILKCPKNVVPVIGFALGYPAETPPIRDRLPLLGIVHQETYREYTNEELLNIYSEKEKLGMRRYKEIPKLRKMVLENNIKNLAQVYTKAKYTRESHLEYSQDVLECLQKQNFLNHQTELAPSNEIELV